MLSTLGYGAEVILTGNWSDGWLSVHVDGVDGWVYGAFVTLFPDGSPQISGLYKDAVLDGAWQRRHPSGGLSEEGKPACLLG